MDADPGQPHHAAGRDQQAEPDQRLGAGPRHQHDLPDIDRHHHRGRVGQERQAGDQRRVPQGGLQVEGEEQQDPERAGADEQHREVGAAPVAVQHYPGR